MAENSESNPAPTSANEGWFNSWLSAAKNKSTEVLEFVKKDLEEFGTAVKNEATSVVSSAGSVMEKTLSLESPDSTVNTVKRSFSTFLGQMNTVLNPGPDDEDTEILIVENSETHELNKFQQALYDLQKDPDTYLSDPAPQLRKQYQCWLEILEPDQLSDERIAKQVNSSEVLKQHYAKLVPEVLEHQLFWKRYLFKRALLEDELARQELQERREQKGKEPCAVPEQHDETSMKWEQDFAADMELTEEEQIALLEQYEKEQKRKSMRFGAKKTELHDSPSDLEQSNVITQEPAVRKSEIPNFDPSGTMKLNKVDSAISLGTPGSSTSSTDDDWEKISDVEK